MALRGENRIKRCLFCEIRSGSGSGSGLVMDVASRGIFVLTRVAPPPGTPVEIRIPAAPHIPEMLLRTLVVRHRLLRGASLQVFSRGLGLRVLRAPEEYRQLVAPGREPIRGPVARVTPPVGRSPRPGLVRGLLKAPRPGSLSSR